jgi:hypothetical protein
VPRPASLDDLLHCRAGRRENVSDVNVELGRRGIEGGRGKTDRLHRTPGGFTTPAFDDHGLRDHLLARPAG